MEYIIILSTAQLSSIFFNDDNPAFCGHFLHNLWSYLMDTDGL